MNVKLLRQIQDQFRQHPETCDMDGFIPDKEHPCGCIAGWGAALRGGFRINMNVFAVFGPNHDRLVWLEEWPAKFQRQYKKNKAQATIARIEHFIQTSGRE